MHVLAWENIQLVDYLPNSHVLGSIPAPHGLDRGHTPAIAALHELDMGHTPGTPEPHEWDTGYTHPEPHE